MSADVAIQKSKVYNTYISTLCTYSWASVWPHQMPPSLGTGILLPFSLLHCSL